VNKIEGNIAARRAAEQVASLAEEEGRIYGQRFWEELVRIAVSHLPQTTASKSDTKTGPMTDAEAKLFGSQSMPFGEFAGMKIDNVPLPRLEWYAEQDFVDQLRRYMQSNRVKQERRGDDDEIG